MCRIVGALSKSLDRELIVRMRDKLSYGGPDDSGVFFDQENFIGLGHRRLSILDTSSAGKQPMIWNDLIIVFNGEIYNFKEVGIVLKKHGYSLNSDSDTEVILKSFELWGYEAVEKFRGMFAFAIWNTKTKKLILCRDRVGVKPLFWYFKNGIFMFASELKAFYEYHEFDKTINQSAVNLFLKTGYIKSPLSIYEFTHKLAPGSFLEIDQDFNIRTWKYWDVREKYYNTNINNKDEKLLIPECEKVLEESFGLRMVSDVPVGLFLSGGVDSSIVTALLQKNSDKPLNTFTIGFHEKKYNEANYAKKVAEHIGTYHTELYCTENDFKDIIVDLPEFYDEPFGDSSAIPTYLVSKLARKSVTVCLSADGGDELFTGYNRYLFAENLASKLSLIPSSFRHVISNMLENIDVRSIEFIQNIFPQINESRIIKLSEALKSQSKIDFLYASTQYISKNKIKQLHLFDCNDEIFDKSILIKENSEYSAFGVVDIESYLEGDILTKVDRATMQVALEGREPFLDHKIIEYALGLPDSVKIKNGDTKWILKQILYQYVPQKLIERPKMGFGIPLENWLKCLLKDDLIQMINDKNFIMSFKLSEDFLKEIVYNYFNKNIGSSYFLWNLYALYSWYKRWLF